MVLCYYVRHLFHLDFKFQSFSVKLYSVALPSPYGSWNRLSIADQYDPEPYFLKMVVIYFIYIYLKEKHCFYCFLYIFAAALPVLV